MARPNPMVQLRNIKDTLRHYGYNAVNVIEGVDSNSAPCIRLEFKAVVWATMNHTVVIRAISNPGSMFPVAALTPSVDGSVSNGVFSFDAFFEDSGAIAAGNAASHRKFTEDVLHVLRGNMQNSVNFGLYAMGTEPKMNGFNGAAANVETAVISVGTLIPGGRVVVPGYLS
jgi:hypothetical protein